MSPHRSPGDRGPGPMPEPAASRKRKRLTKVATHALSGILLSLAICIGSTFAIAYNDVAQAGAAIALLWIFGAPFAFGAGLGLSVLTRGWDSSWFFEEVE